MTGDGRWWETGDGRWETGDGRRETGDGRWEMGDLVGDGRWWEAKAFENLSLQMWRPRCAVVVSHDSQG